MDKQPGGLYTVPVLKKTRALKVCVLAGAAGLMAACSTSKYSPYASPSRDFVCYAPTAWRVARATQGRIYENTTWLGPLDSVFVRGRPSVTVRWYSYGEPHVLPDGLLESYSSADDFIRETLRTLYGPRYVLEVPVHGVRLIASGLEAKDFVVLSPGSAAGLGSFGVSVDSRTGLRAVWRRHEYVVVTLQRGFYVLIYPATYQGYEFYKSDFDELVNTFIPVTEGPGGPAIAYARGGFVSRRPTRS